MEREVYLIRMFESLSAGPVLFPIALSYVVADRILGRETREFKGRLVKFADLPDGPDLRFERYERQ